ncbi:MAG: NYN domain-containing protein [Verrucomicrobia bacterium]|nr:NYN domain-containing protein [Verrucomicrobiota bacterium]
MKTIVYVDGFNFYYGCCKSTGIKWVNPLVLCQKLLPHHTITAIRYFSAEVTVRPDNPDQLNRQRIFFRALRTLPNFSIELGRFLESVKTMPLADSKGGNRFVAVIKTEEKGSDVNLATHLLLDAFDDAMECAVVVSNDSDLLIPIRVVRARFNKKVGLLNPQKRPSRTLIGEVDFYKPIRPTVLAASQFPAMLTDAQGSFHKPATW